MDAIYSTCLPFAAVLLVAIASSFVGAAFGWAVAQDRSPESGQR